MTEKEKQPANNFKKKIGQISFVIEFILSLMVLLYFGVIFDPTGRIAFYFGYKNPSMEFGFFMLSMLFFSLQLDCIGL